MVAIWVLLQILDMAEKEPFRICVQGIVALTARRLVSICTGAGKRGSVANSSLTGDR